MQNLFFDLDGTIIDSHEGVFNCLHYSFDHFGFKIPEGTDLNLFLGPPLESIIKEFCKVDDNTTIAMVAKFRERYSKIGYRENQLYPGIKEAIIGLHDSGKTVCVATSKVEVYARKILEEHGISEYFSDICGADPIRNLSQKHEVIQDLLNRQGISDIHDCIMIGDRKYDVHGAMEFGMDCIGVTFGFGTEDELINAGAKYIVNSPKEMAELLISL